MNPPTSAAPQEALSQQLVIKIPYNLASTAFTLAATAAMRKFASYVQSALNSITATFLAFQASGSPRQASRLGPTIGRKRRKRRQRHLFKFKQFPTNHV
jgi:hypothetical protein